MRLALIIVAVASGALATACHQRRVDSQQTPAITTARSVFTDSVMHAQQCEPTQQGENWRTVCVPRDQRVDVRRKP